MSSNEQPAAAAAAADTDAWRKSVPQSDRNREVREISKVLASLEPGAKSSSKLMLAMKFESQIFTTAKSLEDYKKVIQKRLKRLKKNYKPTNETSAANNTQTFKELQKELRYKYGPALRYIAANSDTAIQELRVKQGSEKATQLQQHTSYAIKWAVDLELVDPKSLKMPKGSPQITKSLLDLSYLQKMQQKLETRLENIRSHVVKLADPDRFLLETLERTEADLIGKKSSTETTTTPPPRATTSAVLADKLQQRFQEFWSQGNNNTATATATAPKQNLDPELLLKDSLEQAQKAVPPPTRTSRNESQGALMHLEKMKAASTAIVAYLAIADKQAWFHKNDSASSSSKAATAAGQKNRLQMRNSTAGEINNDYIMVKAYKVATEGMEVVGGVMKEYRKNYKEPEVTLEDAWNKVSKLSMPPEPSASVATKTNSSNDELEATTTTTTTTETGQVVKKIKLSSLLSRIHKRHLLSGDNTAQIAAATKSRVLLTPNRKTPPNLLPELKKKRATLIRPPSGNNSHLVLPFGKNAFVMTIFFVPLLVALRAMDPKQRKKDPKDDDANNTSEQQQGSSSSQFFLPLHHGLLEREELSCWGVKCSIKDGQPQGKQQKGSSNNESNNTTTTTAANRHKPYETMGHVIEERLRDASAHLTQVLRRRFFQATQDKKSPLDIEILEISTLLKFLEDVRTTYIPNWKDAE